MADGTVRRAWVPMSDGTRLAVTLYLPDQPAPCLLEALPYRMDDLTAAYRPEYLRLRDEHGYAVARADLRGTGSSYGTASDEYPPQEQQDLAEVIGWLAEQPWCTGSVGMFGTSYSGFNALQLAMERPPQLGAVCAIYATDDRYTDDVHYMGGSLRLLDLVDYPLYMVAMNALPQVPAVAGDGWRDEWLRRVDRTEPWLLTWLEQQRDGPYWRHGSLRPGYDRIACPTMLVGGWADGYRNNTLRTVAALARAGVPHRLLLGPWSHMSTATSLPGPHVDLVPEMARWWDRWLRSEPNGVDDEPPVRVFVRGSTRPEPDLALVEGRWHTLAGWPDAWVQADERPLGATGDPPVRHAVRPDVGTAAWISCAGHLPYGQPLDQRADDAASVRAEWSVGPGGLTMIGYPAVVLRVGADQPVAGVSAKLCDVFPDGTSALITRGWLNLTHRDGHDTPRPLEAGQLLEIELELEAAAHRLSPGHRLRLSLTGSDWPNTAAAPRPVVLTFDLGASSLRLPVAELPAEEEPAALPARVDEPPPYDAAGIGWRVEHDVLARITSCQVEHSARTELADGACEEHYAGRVSVDIRSFAQRAEGRARFRLDHGGTVVESEVRLDLVAGAQTYDVTLDLDVREGAAVVATRHWQRSIARDLA